MRGSDLNFHTMMTNTNMPNTIMVEKMHNSGGPRSLTINFDENLKTTKTDLLFKSENQMQANPSVLEIDDTSMMDFKSD